MMPNEKTGCSCLLNICNSKLTIVVVACSVFETNRHLQISTSLPLSLVLRQFGSTSKLSPSDWRAFDRDQDDSVAVETVDGGCR